MTRGRKPIPTHLKVVRGNPGKRALPRNEPAPPEAVDLAPPEWMNERAARYWSEIAPQLKGAGLLSQIDRTALEGLCDAYARWREASETLARTSLLVKAPTSGYLMPNPLIAISNKAFDQVRAMLAEFGMTPSARSRVTAAHEPDVPKDDPAAEFFG